MRDQSDPPDSWMPALDAAFEKQYSAMSWQQMRQEPGFTCILSKKSPGQRCERRPGPTIPTLHGKD